MVTKAFVDLDWVERQASLLRQDLQLSKEETLDPYELAEKMEFIKLLPLDAVQNISLECLQHLCEGGRKHWSAGSLSFPDGSVVVIMNPRHAKTRARATLMEEIAHIHLAHQPSLLSVGGDSITVRSYNAQQEKEAYWVGAAALVTMWQLRQAQWLKLDVQRLADYCEVSIQLVRFRSNVTGIKLV